ncbi:hypothetical protein E2C06_16710 [Dankookia rubra]|uniref:Nitrogen fixation protein n=1 Tax=Dankookia rubra TaxID=1442381 RepID=A0A4R5QG31_9PROT|nr:hypothetical protein [Dankookia rubra]TDH61427.1 hypothetical protein E2C06_16710 [Dankookia rubra]
MTARPGAAASAASRRDEGARPAAAPAPRPPRMAAGATLCPSVSGDPRNAPVIIGVVGEGGVVANLPTPIPLTPGMRARIGGTPEARFRLAGPCAERHCAHWKDAACSLIGRMQEAVAGFVEPREPGAAVPRCGIRAACRWWVQLGPEACHTCPHVHYNPSV